MKKPSVKLVIISGVFIGILIWPICGIISSASQALRISRERTRIKKVMHDLKGAVEAYHEEYEKWPANVKVLGSNSRNIIFIDLDQIKNINIKLVRFQLNDDGVFILKHAGHDGVFGNKDDIWGEIP